MKQLYLPSTLPQDRMEVGDAGYRHLIQVLRLGTGDSIRVLFDNREVWQGRIAEIYDDTCIIALEKPLTMPHDETELILLQGIPKGKKMDQIVRQATECGVSEIIPLETDFSQVKIEKADLEKKRLRWERIVKEALEQSGSGTVTRVHLPVGIDGIPSVRKKNEIGLFFHQTILETNTLHGYLSSYPKKIYLCIGSEGGFSPAETDRLTAAGYNSMHLGSQILRSETAAVYVIGAVSTLVREIHAWSPRK